MKHKKANLEKDSAFGKDEYNIDVLRMINWNVITKNYKLNN